MQRPHGPGCCGRHGGRARKGWIRAAILALLAERPMHGYEMISELNERTGGAWAPSPGSIYPALQLLTDEGLIRGEADGGRRQYLLTDAGRAIIAAQDYDLAPWDAMTRPEDPASTQLREAATQADAAVTQILAVGTEEQKTRAHDVLTEARRSLYRILAESD